MRPREERGEAGKTGCSGEGSGGRWREFGGRGRRGREGVWVRASEHDLSLCQECQRHTMIKKMKEKREKTAKIN